MSMRKESEKPKYTMWQNVWFMVRRSRIEGVPSVPWLCVIAAVLTIGVSVTELLITPNILSRVETGAPLKELLLTILSFTAILLLLSAVKAYVEQNVLLSRVLVRTGLVDVLHRKFCTTSFPNTENQKFIEMVHKAQASTNGNSQATEAIWTTLTDLLRDVLGFVLYLLLLTTLDPVLLIVVLATSLAGFLVNNRINEWGFRHREEESELWKHSDYVTSKAEDVKLAKDIRVFGMKGWLEDLMQTSLRLHRAFLARREKTYLWANVVDVLLAFLRNGAAYFYLLHMVLSQGLSASEFLLYFTAVSGFATWVTGILNRLSTLRKQSLELSVIREYLDWPEQFVFEGGEELKADPSLPYEVKFEHVSFRYPGAEKDTLHDVNLTIPAGEKLAVVGLNGAGKTTLVKLLCGFYDPTEGRVLLNGKDIKEFDRRQYYKLFSAVFQDFSVLETPVDENVTQSITDIDEKKVWDCLEKAGLTEKVNSLPKGLKTPVGKKVFEDGMEFSGGETQRLMLARALYKNGAILVLDEPTAALDPIAENDIYQKYNEMTAGRTSVFISHRLASTRFCDRILFVADGGIAEAGTHESLLASGGRYAELFQVQSRYYQEKEEPAYE